MSSSRSTDEKIAVPTLVRKSKRRQAAQRVGALVQRGIAAVPQELKSGLSEKSSELARWVTSVDRAYTLQSGLSSVANFALSRGFSRDEDARLLFDFLLEAEEALGRIELMRLAQEFIPGIQSDALSLMEAQITGAAIREDLVETAQQRTIMMIAAVDFGLGDSRRSDALHKLLRGRQTSEGEVAGGSSMQVFRISDNRRLVKFLTFGQTFAVHAFISRLAIEAIPDVFETISGQFDP